MSTIADIKAKLEADTRNLNHAISAEGDAVKCRKAWEVEQANSLAAFEAAYAETIAGVTVVRKAD